MRNRNSDLSLQRVCLRGGITVHTDSALHERSGVVVAFTERSGGVSEDPYRSLNLAGHVGDEPTSVDENRRLLLESLGLSALRDRLVTATQVHGTAVHHVSACDAGSGANVAVGPDPIAHTDALITDEVDIPLLMLYADCVPVVLVAEQPRPAVAVIHSGWRGTLDGIAGRTVVDMVSRLGSYPEDLSAYIGPHIERCCYAVDDDVVSHFVNKFDTITAVDGRVDLRAAVIETLAGAGIAPDRIAAVSECTRDRTDRYFSFRAHGVTGRHGALAVNTKV